MARGQAGEQTTLASRRRIPAWPDLAGVVRPELSNDASIHSPTPTMIPAGRTCFHQNEEMHNTKELEKSIFELFQTVLVNKCSL